MINPNEYSDVTTLLQMKPLNQGDKSCANQHIINIDIIDGRFIAWCCACGEKFLIKDSPNEIICELSIFHKSIKSERMSDNNSGNDRGNE